MGLLKGFLGFFRNSEGARSTAGSCRMACSTTASRGAGASCCKTAGKRARCLQGNVVGGARHDDEELRLADLPGGAVDGPKRLAGGIGLQSQECTLHPDEGVSHAWEFCHRVVAAQGYVGPDMD